MREPAVELPVPLRVAAESGRKADRDRLDDAAERVTRLLALVDARNDAALGLAVRHTDGGDLSPGEDLLRLEPGVVRRNAADLGHPSEDADAEGREQALGEPTDGDPRRGLARAGALEHVAD